MPCVKHNIYIIQIITKYNNEDEQSLISGQHIVFKV